MIFLISVLFTIFFIFGVAIKVYTTRTIWCKSATCLVGKTAIITEANRGIGYATALDFAKRGARVILACRNEKRGRETREKIVEETGNKNVVLEIVNLTSSRSIRNFVRKINRVEKRLDILVNNAAVILIKFRQTVDEHQTLMQTNCFSHFFLTNLLIDLMKKTKGSRIVNVSSNGAKWVTKFTLRRLDKPLGPHDIYDLSRVYNNLLTTELAKQLEGTGVTTYSVHSGAIKSDIFRNLMFKTSEEKAQTVIYCSVEKGIENYNGEHFDRCEKIERFKIASDSSLSNSLWEFTEILVNVLCDGNPL